MTMAPTANEPAYIRAVIGELNEPRKDENAEKDKKKFSTH